MEKQREQFITKIEGEKQEISPEILRKHVESVSNMLNSHYIEPVSSYLDNAYEKTISARLELSPEKEFDQDLEKSKGDIEKYISPSNIHKTRSYLQLSLELFRRGNIKKAKQSYEGAIQNFQKFKELSDANGVLLAESDDPSAEGNHWQWYDEVEPELKTRLENVGHVVDGVESIETIDPRPKNLDTLLQEKDMNEIAQRGDPKNVIRYEAGKWEDPLESRYHGGKDVIDALRALNQRGAVDKVEQILDNFSHGERSYGQVELLVRLYSEFGFYKKAEKLYGLIDQLEFGKIVMEKTGSKNFETIQLQTEMLAVKDRKGDGNKTENLRSFQNLLEQIKNVKGSTIAGLIGHYEMSQLVAICAAQGRLDFLEKLMNFKDSEVMKQKYSETGEGAENLANTIHQGMCIAAARRGDTERVLSELEQINFGKMYCSPKDMPNEPVNKYGWVEEDNPYEKNRFVHTAVATAIRSGHEEIVPEIKKQIIENDWLGFLDVAEAYLERGDLGKLKNLIQEMIEYDEAQLKGQTKLNILRTDLGKDHPRLKGDSYFIPRVVTEFMQVIQQQAR